MNNEVRKKLNISRKLNKMAKLCNTNEASNAHKLARREAKKAWKKSQKEYFAKLASQISLDKSCNNSKKQWKLLKAMYAADKSSSIPALVTSGVTHNTNQTKAECLNSFFAMQSQIDISKEPPLAYEINYLTTERFLTIDVAEGNVQNILKSLDENKATGPDALSNLVVQKLCLLP